MCGVKDLICINSLAWYKEKQCSSQKEHASSKHLYCKRFVLILILVLMLVTNSVCYFYFKERGYRGYHMQKLPKSSIMLCCVRRRKIIINLWRGEALSARNIPMWKTPHQCSA